MNRINNTYLGRIGNKNTRYKMPTLLRDTYVVGYGILNTHNSLPTRESEFKLAAMDQRY